MSVGYPSLCESQMEKNQFQKITLFTNYLPVFFKRIMFENRLSRIDSQFICTLISRLNRSKHQFLYLLWIGILLTLSFLDAIASLEIHMGVSQSVTQSVTQSLSHNSVLKYYFICWPCSTVQYYVVLYETMLYY
jgi:hypothetical protein